MLNIKYTVFKCQIVAWSWITRVIDNWSWHLFLCRKHAVTEMVIFPWLTTWNRAEFIRILRLRKDNGFQYVANIYVFRFLLNIPWWVKVLQCICCRKGVCGFGTLSQSYHFFWFGSWSHPCSCQVISSSPCAKMSKTALVLSRGVLNGRSGMFVNDRKGARQRTTEWWTEKMGYLLNSVCTEQHVWVH